MTELLSVGSAGNEEGTMEAGISQGGREGQKGSQEVPYIRAQ